MYKRRNKYNNTPITVDGVRFDSKGEYAVWADLQSLEKAGEITELERQITYELHGLDGSVACKIKPDFRYRDPVGLRVVDFKGMETREFKTKKKLFEAEYGIPLEVWKSGGDYEMVRAKNSTL